MEIIEIDNNNVLKVGNDVSLKETTNIENINLSKVFSKKVFVLNIDFSKFNENEYKKILRHLLFIKSLLLKLNKKIGVIEDSKLVIGYLLNYDKNNEKQKEFISAINAIFYDNRCNRYNYIYDSVCEYLDDFFYGKNLCDFKNNKCGEKRNTSSVTGCCHHFKPKWLGPLSPKLVLCEYLNKENYTCDAKCLPCKLFTCDYLEKKGVKFKIKDILLLDVFFNPIQKYFIKYMVFTPKEKILKRLLHF